MTPQLTLHGPVACLSVTGLRVSSVAMRVPA